MSKVAESQNRIVAIKLEAVKSHMEFLQRRLEKEPLSQEEKDKLDKEIDALLDETRCLKGTDIEGLRALCQGNYLKAIKDG